MCRRLKRDGMKVVYVPKLSALAINECCLDSIAAIFRRTLIWYTNSFEIGIEQLYTAGLRIQILTVSLNWSKYKHC